MNSSHETVFQSEAENKYRDFSLYFCCFPDIFFMSKRIHNNQKSRLLFPATDWTSSACSWREKEAVNPENSNETDSAVLLFFFSLNWS